jgi:hypothetical protein
MYNTNEDRLPSKPYEISSLATLRNFEAWIKENQLDHLQDADGLTWDLAIHSREIPHPDNPRKALWEITFDVHVNVRMDDLVRTGAFDPKADARLIALAGSGMISMRMRPRSHNVNSADEARTLIVDEMPRLRAEFAANSLIQTKRQIVGRWIEKQCVFGSAV